MKIIDISRDLLNTEVYPGDPEPESKFVKVIGDDSDCNLSTLFTCVHTGTHADAPLHFIEGGKTVDELDLERFIGPCKVIEVPHGAITGEYVNDCFPQDCERLLIKGDGEAYFMGSAAEEVAALGIRLLGTDSMSVGTSGAQVEPHRAFLSAEIAVLEGLDLSDVVPGDYFLFAPPIKLGGLEGAPSRAILISDYIFWSTGEKKIFK
ncbi:MAG: cyclase family protein [Clostridia bacterium]|nr:cyclase family protein [Clostridia bacterium]